MRAKLRYNKLMLKTFLSALIGAFLGLLGAKYLFVGSWLSLPFWGLVGLALAYWSGKRQALFNGAIYGFLLAFVFMLSGYSGSASLVSRLPFFAGLGLVGAVCGLGLGWLGSFARARWALRKDRSA